MTTSPSAATPTPPSISARNSKAVLTSSNYLSVASHYDRLLSEHYTWMFGGYETKLAQNRTTLLHHLSAEVTPGTVAVDLGCGAGFQTIPLLELGYEVVAIDASSGMLHELRDEVKVLGIDEGRLKTVEGDLFGFREHVLDGTAGCVVCMGDTPTHLASLDEVREMIRDAYASLAPQGRLILQFRDLTVPLEGTDRFVPVRSDAMTVFTCFLEWEKDGQSAVDEDGSGARIRVHDLVHIKKGNGTWELCKSWYYKLAMSKAWVGKVVQEAGFTVEYGDTEHGMELVIGIKP
ncbi:S-adenosyl-L-methionine-dependent methyltransferase [Phlyctochytrium arcticum]|nr:S-adenosyl-L-methionine-dependent methyltransferase [Phlyctochytrium arcticum]